MSASAAVIAIKVSWVLCCVVVLAMTLYAGAPKPGNDIGIFLMGSMLFLAFPISILVAGLATLLILLQESAGAPFLDVIGSGYVGFGVTWLVLFVAGYWQWFKLVPWLWRKVRARRAGTSRGRSE